MPRPTDEHRPALLQQRFTNREAHLGVFHRHMEAVTAPIPALMFYGVGGAGKSWLLRKMRSEMTGNPAAPSILVDYTLEQGKPLPG